MDPLPALFADTNRANRSGAAKPGRMTVLMSIDVDALALEDPDRYRRLLDGYFLLLGERRLWWQRCAESDDPRWKSCVRVAIERLAKTSAYTPRRLADLLDRDDFPKARRRVMSIARALLYAEAAA